MIDRTSEDKNQDRQKSQYAQDDIIQLIVFNLGGEEFSADIRQVREIILRGIITPIPDSPEFILGVTNVRGEITVVIDLKARFFLSQEKGAQNKHIIITEQEKNLYGLMVDEVTQVLRIPENSIKPAPKLVTKIDRKYIKGVITLDDRLILLINLTEVLSEDDLTRLAALNQEQRKTEHAKIMKEEEGETPEAKKKKSPEQSSRKRKAVN